MVERKVIIDRVVEFANSKLTELSSSNPIFMITRPLISRAINNNINKLDSVLKLIQDKDGNIDVENIASEMIDNLLVSNIKKYPDILNGVEVGNGSIRINLPFVDKTIVFDTDDIEEFKNNLIAK